MRRKLAVLRAGVPAATDAPGATVGISETEEALTQNLVDDPAAFSQALSDLTDWRRAPS